MLLGALDESLLGNMLARKGAIRDGEGKISASKGATNPKGRAIIRAGQNF